MNVNLFSGERNLNFYWIFKGTYPLPPKKGKGESGVLKLVDYNPLKYISHHDPAHSHAYYIEMKSSDYFYLIKPDSVLLPFFKQFRS